MKVLLLLFLVGCATAFVVQNGNAVEQDQEFLFEIERAEAEAKTEMGKKLQAILDTLLEKIKKEADKGKHVEEAVHEKVKEVLEKLEGLKMDIGHKAKELIKLLKEKSDHFWDYILGNKESQKEMAMAHASFDLKEMFRNFKQSLLSKIDKEKLKEKVNEIFGKGNEMADALLDIINKAGDKYKQKLHDLVDRYLGKEKRKRSIKELWENVKNYFKDLHIDIQEKYMKFGEWVKEHAKNALGKGKDKIENIKSIAQEFIKNTKDVSKDVAVEAMEFLKPYKEDLGALWDQLRETVKEIVKKED